MCAARELAVARYGAAMRAFKGSAVLAVIVCLVAAATAVAKVDQTGWPKISGANKEHFFRAWTTVGKNGDANITGTEQSDKILGAHGSDRLIGLGGVDVIWGDEIPNNPANQTDYIDGGAGGDFLYASHGYNTMIGGPGNDKIHAHYGRGTISCGAGKDKVWQSHKRRKGWKIGKDCEIITYALDSHMDRK
jgi:hypothetical protein